MIRQITLAVGLCSLLSVRLLAQNNQIDWSRNKALQDGTATWGIHLSGKGLYYNQIELSPMLSEHQEFVGRASNIGSFSVTSLADLGHATMVASVAAAAGVAREAKGIAYQATIRNYSLDRFTTDLITGKLGDVQQRLVVNLSFSGSTTDNLAALLYGSYDHESNSFDALSYDNPYLLPVAAAGNFGLNDNPKPNTLPLTWGYDKLMAGIQTAKNSLVVGNIANMLLANDKIKYAFIDVTSSAGPTDDMRIKPELCAPGGGLLVANQEPIVSDNYYKAYRSNPRGTSFACPIVSGTALLLQELYVNRNKQYMRAATVKGLLLHTAEKIYPYMNGGDTETVNWGISATDGPDPFCGYGLVNATAAAQAILTRGKGNSSIIDEKILLPGRFDIVDVTTTAGQPVTVSIAWTDPSRYNMDAPFDVPVNSTSPVLVNDLGVVVVEYLKNSKAVNRTFYPDSFTQQNQRLVTVSDRRNRVDTYEKIRFTPSPDCTYSIIVSPESSTLWGGSQAYSLIVTGLGLDPQHAQPHCTDNKVIKTPIQAGVNEEAVNELTLAAEITPEAGLTEFNALDLVLIDGALVRNPDALFVASSCSLSGVRQIASPSEMTTATQSLQQPDNPAEEGLQIYPNPLNEVCTVKSEAVLKTLSIYTVEGKLLMQQVDLDDSAIQVDTSFLPFGTYVFVTEDAAGRKRSKRMSKF